MSRTVWFIALMLVALPFVGWSQSTDQFTPVVVSPLLPGTQRVLGTDGQDHVVYELEFTNTSQASATLKKLEVFDDRDPSVALAVYEGDTLLSLLRTLGNTRPETPELAFNETRLVLLHLAFDPSAGVPHRLVHRVGVLGAAGLADLTPVPLSYMVAPVRIRPRIRVVGPRRPDPCRRPRRVGGQLYSVSVPSPHRRPAAAPARPGDRRFHALRGGGVPGIAGYPGRAAAAPPTTRDPRHD
jgi:hypothetical protein